MTVLNMEQIIKSTKQAIKFYGYDNLTKEEKEKFKNAKPIKPELIEPELKELIERMKTL